METTSFFEKKINITPSDFNRLKKISIESILLEKAIEQVENKCSEHGFVLPGSIKLVSRSVPQFEVGNKSGDAISYVKLEGKVIYPADGVRIIGEVIRKNKMGLYVEYKKAIRIQVPRDLHIGNEEYESVEIGNMVNVELKRSKFQINDPYILASGVFISRVSDKYGEQYDTVDDSSDVGQESKVEDTDYKEQLIEKDEESKIDFETESREQIEGEEGEEEGEEEEEEIEEGEGEEGEEGKEADE
jgi:hypothetical protein